MRLRLLQQLFAALVVFFVLFLLFPIYWMIVTALKPEGEIFVRQPAPGAAPGAGTGAGAATAAKPAR